MEEIKVGEYIRTRHGKIGKVIDITNITGQKREKYLIKWNKAEVYYITGVTITKHSKNIIDLIEVGDYVNGKYVYKITPGCIYFKGHAPENKHSIWIKTIVTKEQFKSIEYEV